VKKPGSLINPSTKVPANAGRQVSSAKPLSSGGKMLGSAHDFTAGNNQPLLAPAKSDQKRDY
jgi:hypothetical protein